MQGKSKYIKNHFLPSLTVKLKKIVKNNDIFNQRKQSCHYRYYSEE